MLYSTSPQARSQLFKVGGKRYILGENVFVCVQKKFATTEFGATKIGENILLIRLAVATGLPYHVTYVFCQNLVLFRQATARCRSGGIRIQSHTPRYISSQIFVRLPDRFQPRPRLLIPRRLLFSFSCTRESRPLLLAANTDWSRSVLLLAFGVRLGFHQLHHSLCDFYGEFHHLHTNGSAKYEKWKENCAFWNAGVLIDYDNCAF